MENFRKCYLKLKDKIPFFTNQYYYNAKLENLSLSDEKLK